MAPTGSGKTTRYVIPNLLELQGSAVVTDPSGEIYRATSGHLARRGYSVQVLQPAAPGESLKFNPLACFGSPQELRRLATVLCETGLPGATAAPARGSSPWRSSPMPPRRPRGA